MRHSEDRIKRWGASDSTAIIQDGKPLFDSIKRISIENDLNKEQIKRISEIANTRTMVSIYDSKVDNTSEFEVVNPLDVIRQLGKCDQKPIMKMNRLKTASLDYSRSFKSNLAPDLMRVKLASHNRAQTASNTSLEIKLVKMKKIATLLKGEGEYANSMAKRSLYKHASKIDDLAKAIMAATKKGITNDEMINAALRMGDDPAIVRKAFSKALEVIKNKTGGIFGSISNMASNAWSGVKSFFKVASDGTMSIDQAYLMDKIALNKRASDDSDGKVLDKKHPLNKALADTFQTRETAKEDDGIARTVNDVAAAAAKQVERIETKLKGNSND